MVSLYREEVKGLVTDCVDFVTMLQDDLYEHVGFN